VTADPLANAAWHALTGPQSDLGVGSGGARMFDPSVAPFCAVADEPTPSDWADLAAILPADGGVLFRPPLHVPGGWQRADSWPCFQMTAPARLPAADDADGPPIVELSRPDVPEMIDLVQRTRPGPFFENTIETGRYLGIRIDGQLAAMAGERLRVPGATEISAVCADPAFRRRGLARRVFLAVAAAIAGRGDLPFLHVVSENRSALALYESVGFTVARDVDAVVIGAPGRPRPASRAHTD
jgi:ribosomal protein S18 acetylase RimI-like enzyme